MVRRYRDDTPHQPSASPRQQAPLVALPHLRQPRIAYSPTTEAALFDIECVYTYLSHWHWQRTVDSTGQLSLGAINRRIGLPFCGHVVKLHFDPLTYLF